MIKEGYWHMTVPQVTGVEIKIQYGGQFITTLNNDKVWNYKFFWILYPWNLEEEVHSFGPYIL